jgi:hypothetical protein
MKPFHFGSYQRHLFGSHEPAQENFGKVRTVLLCYPVGNEHIFAYRTTRLLAARLLQAGFHVLRSARGWAVPYNPATITNRVRPLSRRVRGGGFGVGRAAAGYSFDPRKSPPTRSGLAAMTAAFKEFAVQFGPSASLIGILSRPPSELLFRRPAVVILNTGIAHRVGHHRMYVTMARVLAALGHLAFRFDFSGIGDSAGRGNGLSPIEAHQADLSEALDWLTASCDVNEVVLIGLCSGADIALSYGDSDERGVGFVLLDPTIPPTVRFYAHYLVAA